jgi:polysaccharide export outer membrane protein
MEKKAVKHSALAVLALAFTVLLATSAWAAPQESPAAAAAPTPGSPTPTSKPAAPRVPNYVLGPDDVIAIKALNAEEIDNPSVRIDPRGQISLPMVGRLTAGGLSVEALENELAGRLKTYVRQPTVAVTVVEYRSQPVSVIGAVAQTGVHQLEGRKTLIEMLAKAGGLRPDAGNIVKITRRVEWGPIPLSTAVTDPTESFSIAEVSLNDIIQGSKPEENIPILPNDIISVPRANLVYVIGEVKKPGGFVLQERRNVSGLHALAMAEGLTDLAAAGKAMIIRQTKSGERIEIAANLKAILSGQQRDVEMLPEDILFVPTNQAKSIVKTTVQTAISAATSAFIYQGF